MPIYNKVFKRGCLCLIALFSCCALAKAQPALDTIRVSLKSKPQLFGKLDSRNSFIGNSRAKVFGCKIGLNYSDRLYFGLGYNQLYPPANAFKKQLYYTNSANLHDSVTAELKLFYISTHAEYIYYQTKHWDLSILLQFGVGQTYYQYLQSEQGKKTDKNLIFIYEPAISVEYKIVKWAGIGVDTGFRFLLTDYRKVSQRFNSPTYAFKFLIYYNEIYKSIKEKIKQ
jgi:hypothetical protein